MSCYCGLPTSFGDCCEPLILGQATARSAEALMRSRYSAYATGHFEYIYNTYAASAREALSVEEIQQSAMGTHWLKLEVLVHKPGQDQAWVEFKAFSKAPHSSSVHEPLQFYCLHETSEFIKEAGEWRYLSGDIHTDSGVVRPGRNDACPCNSGKKFKKCCGR